MTNLVTSRLTKNVTPRNLLKSLDKILSITSISCNFTNLYKVFFLNDFIDLKVFFKKWHEVGIGIAIYKGRFDGSPVLRALKICFPCLFTGLRDTRSQLPDFTRQVFCCRIGRDERQGLEIIEVSRSRSAAERWKNRVFSIT